MFSTSWRRCSVNVRVRSTPVQGSGIRRLASSASLNPTQSLAQFIVGHQVDTSAASRPANEARRMALNLLSVMLSGSVEGPSRNVMRWAQSEGTAARSTVFGPISNFKASPSVAAFVNAFSSHLQDYCDTHLPTKIHPTTSVLPAVMAVAEDTNSTQQEALAAFVIGNEVACRVASSVHPFHYDDGWHITGTAGVAGAAAGAARLLKLSEGETVTALGHAMTQASGLREVFGSDGKPFHPGVAARNGVQAAQLAKHGVTSCADIIGGRRGFWEIMSPRGHDAVALTRDLGKEWTLFGVGLKPYANCLLAQAIQDGVIHIRNEVAASRGGGNIEPEAVSNIKIRCSPMVKELISNFPEPETGLQGKFSFHHCAAAAYIDGAGHEAQFSEHKMKDPEIARLRRLVTATYDESIREDEAYVEIEISRGGDTVRFERHVEHATGTPENPMPTDMLKKKWHELATGSGLLTDAQSESVCNAVLSLGFNDSHNRPFNELVGQLAPTSK